MQQGELPTPNIRTGQVAEAHCGHLPFAVGFHVADVMSKCTDVEHIKVHKDTIQFILRVGLGLRTSRRHKMLKQDTAAHAGCISTGASKENGGV